jgi:hypothetical protein
MQNLSKTLTLYHSSFVEISKFYPLTHFGTRKAAVDRLKNTIDDMTDDATPFKDRKVYIYPVKLSISSPLHTPDIYNERPFVVWEVATHITKTSDLTHEQRKIAKWLMKSKTTPVSCKKLQNLLQSMGYDSLMYHNTVEDPGKLSYINLSSSQVKIGEPIVMKASEIIDLIPEKIEETMKELERPKELGEAYFYINDELIDIDPYRNHRDWLVANATKLGLPDYIQKTQTKALWEGYKKGFVRLVWDQGGKWMAGAGTGQGNVLYINGVVQDVWNNIKSILNEPRWLGHIDTVVIEYVREKDGKPNWYQTDIFKGGDLESLYRGKRPRKQLAPPDAIYGGEQTGEDLMRANKLMNELNDNVPEKLFEFFNQHFLTSDKFDINGGIPQNKYVLQKTNDNIYF